MPSRTAGSNSVTPNARRRKCATTYHFWSRSKANRARTAREAKTGALLQVTKCPCKAGFVITRRYRKRRR